MPPSQKILTTSVRKKTNIVRWSIPDKSSLRYSLTRDIYMKVIFSVIFRGLMVASVIHIHRSSTRFHPMLIQCWSNISHGEPTLIQHWVDMSLGEHRLDVLTHNPLPAKLFNLNFHPLEVVCRWRDSQLQVSENYSNLTKSRSTVFKYCWLMSLFIFNMFKRWYLMW